MGRAFSWGSRAPPGPTVRGACATSAAPPAGLAERRLQRDPDGANGAGQWMDGWGAPCAPLRSPEASGLSAAWRCGCEGSLETPRSQEKPIGGLRLARRSRDSTAGPLGRGSAPAASGPRRNPSWPFGRREGLELAKVKGRRRCRGKPPSGDRRGGGGARCIFGEARPSSLLSLSGCPWLLPHPCLAVL